MAKKTTTKTTKWDTAEYLTTDRHIAGYLAEAFNSGDPAGIALALSDIARAKGITAMAELAGIDRASLVKALAAEGRLEFATMMKVITALGVQLKAAPAAKRRH